MRYRVNVHAKDYEIFEALLVDYRRSYYIARHKLIPLETIRAPFIFDMPLRVKKSNRIERATLKMIEYNYPHSFTYTYKSRTMFITSGCEINILDDKTCEVVVNFQKQKLAPGTTPIDVDFSKQRISNFSFMRRWRIETSMKEIKRQKELEEAKKIQKEIEQ